ncbi:MAG: HlyD family efflux transporter periplasmic adaptor subunit [Candidatus Absconditabacteria bacterium]|nr:HlyD family efflux transporter periplasmic adaptor subunit [Candidatus Absconditabacteria bacterium]MDD4714182.1 HlyD family efflux transporter periplasmic adaptor subunit [Candidatus Absconditabacteria bacterium]
MKFPKLTKNIWIVGGAALLLVLILGFFLVKKLGGSDNDSVDYLSNDMPVMKGDVVNSLMMNGRAKFSNMQKLTFQQSGKITGVYKKVGDSVKAGEVIARMDSYEIDNELEQAMIDLENEERALDKAQDTSRKQLEILQAQKTYEEKLYQQQTADQALKLTLQTIENEAINKKNNYEQAAKDYEKKQKDYATQKATYEEILALNKGDEILNADEVLKEMVDDSKYLADDILKELDALDKVMIYTTKYWGTEFDYHRYSTKDQNLKDTVEMYFWRVFSVATEVYKRANTLDISELSQVQLKSLLIQRYETIRQLADDKTLLSEATDKLFTTTDSEDSPSVSVTIANGRALKDTANKAIDEILGLTTPETIGQKRKDELEKLALELNQDKQALDKLKIEYDQADVEKQKKITDARMEYEMRGLEAQIAKTAWEDLKSGDNEEIKLIQNTIKQKKKNIETIMKKYEEYVLKANFDGVITKMNLQVGDNVGTNSSSSSDTEKYVYIENPDTMEIQLDVDQADIIKLRVGMEVQISLDALPMSPYTGTLTEIDTTAGDDEYGYYGGGGTTYKAKVIFTKKPEDTILGAMTAMVTIVLEEAYDVLVVPNIAISTTAQGAVVMRVEDGKYKKAFVQLGISDMANTEVLSGLEEGDIIMGVYLDKEGMAAAGIGDYEPNYDNMELGGFDEYGGYEEDKYGENGYSEGKYSEEEFNGGVSNTEGGGENDVNNKEEGDNTPPVTIQPRNIEEEEVILEATEEEILTDQEAISKTTQAPRRR